MSNEELDEGLNLYPPWKEALKAFEERGYTYGDLLTKEWFIRAIGMDVPAPDARFTIEQLNRFELSILQQFKPFRTAVLEKFQMDLVSDRAGAYLIIAPKDQPERALRDMNTGIKREMDRGLARIRNVNAARLTAQERQQFMDVMAKAADMASRISGRRALPMDEE